MEENNARTPIDIADLEKFLESRSADKNMKSRILNIIRRRAYTVETLMNMDFDNQRILGLSKDTVNRYIRPYQRMLISEAEERAKIERNKIIKTLIGNSEIFKYMDAAKIIVDVHHKKFITNFISNIPEYDEQSPYIQRDFLVILDEYKALLIDILDDLGKLKEE